MARLRQQHPQNYVSSGNIHTDFENVIRYINAAELGDKTVGELLAVLFNETGDFTGPIEIRVVLMLIHLVRTRHVSLLTKKQRGYLWQFILLQILSQKASLCEMSLGTNQYLFYRTY